MGGQWQMWIGIGNLVRDPEKKANDGGHPRTVFTVAISKTYKVGSERRQKTFYAKCVCWGHEANYMAKYAKKGSLVKVIGEVEEHDYTDRAGIKRTATSIDVNEVEVLGLVKQGAIQQPEPAAEDPATGLPEGW